MRHKCNFDLNEEDGHLPIILTPPKNLEETLQFLEMNLCVSDIIALCRLQSWALKGYWPLVFPGRGHSVPLLHEYTASSKSNDILRELIKDNQVVHLPKKIVIKDNSRNLTALLRESTLEPRSHSFTSGPYEFVVTGRNQGDQNLVTSQNTVTVHPMDATLAQDCADTPDHRENDDIVSRHSSHSSATQTASPQSSYASQMQDFSDTEDEIFFEGSQFGDVPPDPRANDDTLSYHSVLSNQSSIDQHSALQTSPPDPSDTEDEIFFEGPQFGGIPPDPRANDDTVSFHSDLSHQSSIPQPASMQTAHPQSPVPQLSSAQSNTPQSTVSPESSSLRSIFQSILPENLDPGLDGLGKFIPSDLI